jgi:hypothetical protein
MALSPGWSFLGSRTRAPFLVTPHGNSGNTRQKYEERNRFSQATGMIILGEGLRCYLWGLSLNKLFSIVAYWIMILERYHRSWFVLFAHHITAIFQSSYRILSKRILLSIMTW